MHERRLSSEKKQPSTIEVHGARVHNLKNIDASIPLNKMVGIAGVSGSGKSSLALGVLYAEGSRRYMDALSTYTRRRISQAGRADVDYVEHVPAALALRQRPQVPGVRSTFGTSTELLNHLRLLFSRVGSHCCPNGHPCPPTINVSLEKSIVCPVCGAEFFGPGAEMMAFNSDGACPTCEGTGTVRQVDLDSLVPDESLSIDEGAVAPWNTLMWDLMKQVCGAMGVRTDVPFHELTERERDIVFNGPAEKKHILYRAKKGDAFAELDFTYFNAVHTVENALAKVKDEKGLKRVSRFLKEGVCPDCHGARFSKSVLSSTVLGLSIAEVCAFTLDELYTWITEEVSPKSDDRPKPFTSDVQAMANTITAGMIEPMVRLKQLGLGYLSLDRASSTLSTGELQRVALSRAVRNRTTGVLYVLDEPSIGLHPSNVDGLLGVIDDLLADGNSVVIVDHDTRVLRESDHLIEIGPGSGVQGGQIIAQGTVSEVENNPHSRIGAFLSSKRVVATRQAASRSEMFDHGSIELSTAPLHTVNALDIRIPRSRLIAVTGVSGSGKTTLILESLVPAVKAAIEKAPLPNHIRHVDANGIKRIDLIDATPIGINVRSTVATYSGILDELRKAYASTSTAKAGGLKAGAFSYNTGSLRCPTCDGTGQISLDVQFLPDVDIQCPDCKGSRYAPAADEIVLHLATDEQLSLPQLLALTVDEALPKLQHIKGAHTKLKTLSELGLGYLTLGESTPALSGGEAQRLKLASEMKRSQAGSVFVFDEPTIGLHPLDVELLLDVFQKLIDQGATVIVIEHDLDFIANADYIIDMGPGGGTYGGNVVCSGTSAEVCACPQSITGQYLAGELETRNALLY